MSTPWMTAEEAAEYLRMDSVKALYTAVRRGFVPGHRRGKRGLLFHRDELDKAMMQRKTWFEDLHE